MVNGSSVLIGRATFWDRARLRLLALLIISAVCAATGVLVSTALISKVAWAVSLGLLGLVVALFVAALWQSWRSATVLGYLKNFIENDRAALLISDASGGLLACNPIAAETYGVDQPHSIADALATHVANPDGVVFRMIARARENRHAEEELKTSKGRITLAASAVGPDHFLWSLGEMVRPDGHEAAPALPMLMLSHQDKVLFANDAAERLIGQTIKSLDDVFPKLPFSSGSITEISCAEGVTRALVTEVDAGSGRRAIYLLPAHRTTEALLEWRAFQDLPVPLIKVSPDGTIEAFNRVALALVGLALKEDIHLSQLMEGLGRSITDWLAETAEGRGGPNSEFLRLRRTDKEVFVQVTLNRVIEDGSPRLIAVLSDATELKSLEAQFVQSQKMQAIGQLAGGVAHDFNNLLTAISGHCDLLLLRHDQGDPDYSDLVQINQNANRAAALVGQLLAFSRKQTLRPETVDMRDTLADLTHLLNRLVGEKVTLTLSHDPVLKAIRADKRQLEQVLMNLVVNARDAMPEGGEIRISTECIHFSEPLERDRATVPRGEYVAVKVADEGVGISADKLQKVFEPFFTTKRTGEGTGLGLSTAYGIVKQTGGYIFVDSDVGKGTCFTLYFPVMDGPSDHRLVISEELPKPAATHADGVILLVEDEAPVRAFASRALRLRGYTVLEADSAEAALKLLEDDSLSIDVFVTDVVMPGLDGPSWVREALKNRPDVRIVFVSGYAEDSFGETQMKIPNSVFLPKPFSLNELTETVQRQLN